MGFNLSGLTSALQTLLGSENTSNEAGTGIANAINNNFSEDEISSTGIPLTLKRLTSAVTGAYSILKIIHETSGNMADGFAAVLRFDIKDASAEEMIGFLGFERAGADDIGRFILYTVDGGTNTKVMQIQPGGGLQLLEGSQPSTVSDMGGLWVDSSDGSLNFVDPSGTNHKIT